MLSEFNPKGGRGNKKEKVSSSAKTTGSHRVTKGPPGSSVAPKEPPALLESQRNDPLP